MGIVHLPASTHRNSISALHVCRLFLRKERLQVGQPRTFFCLIRRGQRRLHSAHNAIHPSYKRNSNCGCAVSCAWEMALSTHLPSLEL